MQAIDRQPQRAPHGVPIHFERHRPEQTALYRLVQQHAATFIAEAEAAKLPDPTRTVYRCQEAGRVIYSDAPCLGAQKVDVQPTRGLNKSSGTERVGKDVSGERLNEAVAGATRPITAMTVEERAVNHRRFTLSPAVKAECALLDRRQVCLETAEREAIGVEQTETQKQLFESRLRARDIGC